MIDQSDIRIVMSDGIEVAVRIFRPAGDGLFPTLFAASPYRYDNDDMPVGTTFFWHETGPIHWYVERGYAYVHLDVRGSGKSDGEFQLYSRRERTDLYEVIEWIAQQSWSNGKVGGIGQSYYATSQWAMAAERPPHLACIAPYDGNIDPYRSFSYPGGIPSAFTASWWNGSVRVANKFPANGSRPRDLQVDIVAKILEHPLFDEFWEDRSFFDKLGGVDIPVYSIGIWAKRDIHLDGNIRGYQLVNGPKKLKLIDAGSGAATLARFASEEFHSQVLLPFYDHYLKGEPTGYLDRPAIEYDVAGTELILSDTAWPPEATRCAELYLSDGPTGSVTSLNDGALSFVPQVRPSRASYAYPGQGWVGGPVVMTKYGPDPVAGVLTYTSPPLTQDLDIAGAAELVLRLSSSRNDANVIVRLFEQMPMPEPDRAAGKQPPSRIVAKGWLKASHRTLDERASAKGTPLHSHRKREDLVPGEPVQLRITLTNCAYRFRKGSRIRVEVCCADSALTDMQFSHLFTPDMVGTDTVHQGSENGSRLLLPVFDISSFGNSFSIHD
jgi:predicted acyl esterase